MPFISRFSNAQHPWAVFLAGGDGTRLRSLTSKIAGDSRPKQFCRILGDKSLMSQTRDRIGSLFEPNRTMFVVTRAHEAFYREDLLSTAESRVVAQTCNRGTGVAVAAALLRILESDADPVVAFFPCDHYYSNGEAFVRTVRCAMRSAVEHPYSIVLLGAEAHYPEVEYGWIEPGSSVPSGATLPIHRLNRFWEKPTLITARELLNRGCLWNTFVTIGQASAFLELLHSQIPDVMLNIGAGDSHDDLDSAYPRIRPVDFSREVLAAVPHRLIVVRDSESGWADLGDPTRLIDTLVTNRIEPPWLKGIAVEMR